MQNLFEIIEAQDLEALKEFLIEYPRGMSVQTESGVWALHKVMALGNLEMAKYVTEYVIVDLNLLDREGNTVLHYGVDSGNLELVRYLTERVGSPVDQANLHGETPLDRAIRLGRREIQAYFEERLGASAAELYHNPVCRGMHPDPSVVRVGEDYYMVNSSFVFFPCIPISHSRDLIHWKTIGYAITNPDWARLKGLEGGRGYWAPDISYYEGRFYITATYRLNEGGLPQRLQMVTSSDQPEGPYCEPVFLEEDGIDPSIFSDVDGRRYMLLNRGARIFEISKDGTQILSEPMLLWYGQNKKAAEGPHLLYKDGYYYLFMAEGGTGMGHRITVARSRELRGVYESCPYNPILRQWDEKRLIQCSGHGMPVDTPDGDWYMVYLCNRIGTSGQGILGRETCLDPIVWTADGWPLVNSLKGPSELQRRPRLGGAGDSGKAPAVTPSSRNRFSEENFTMHLPSQDDSVNPEKNKDRASAFDNSLWADWYTVRGAKDEFFEKQGEDILVRGNGSDLNTLDYGTILVKPQQEFRFTASVTVSVENAENAETDWDAGMTCYYDENSYLKLALAQRDGRLGILAAEYVDDRYVTETFLPLASQTSRAKFRIVTDHLRRTLFFRAEGDWEQAAVLENTVYLCSSGLKKGKRFTGAMTGVYVCGRVTARFAGFQAEYLSEVR
ncbi:MAG: family 43 glycosylhydrolase [Roseburia sp.]|nr:family 43 glycosylhydrolase [Roseburia sp.]MCM1098134.1 family 43 glycosylhydrolase [Ruminococcus flavefaciens]